MTYQVWNKAADVHRSWCMWEQGPDKMSDSYPPVAVQRGVWHHRGTWSHELGAADRKDIPPGDRGSHTDGCHSLAP